MGGILWFEKENGKNMKESGENMYIIYSVRNMKESGEKKVNFSHLFGCKKKRKKKLCIENIFYTNNVNRKQKVEKGEYGNRNLELPTFLGTSYKPNRLMRKLSSFCLSINTQTKTSLLGCNNEGKTKKGDIFL